MHVQALMMSAIPTSAPPPSLVVHTSANSTNTTDVTTSGINTTGATFLVVNIGHFGATTTGTFSDSKGNTWTAVSRFGAGTTVDVLMYFCYSPIVGSGHTFTYTTNPFGSYVSIEVLAFKDITTSAINASAGASTSSTSTAQPGSITPSVAHTLVITGLGFADNTAGAVSVNGGYTISDTQPFVGTGASNFGSSAAYLVLSSASAQNPTWNVTNSTSQVTASIVAFAY